MNKGGGGGRKIPGQPPRNGRKDRDEDLLLFREMHKREKERIVSLLQPVSDEFEPNGGNYASLYRIASAKKGSGNEFLAEREKNDYDWLKTPPATPLFPSLEMEANAPELAVQREIPILQPLSRFSGNSETLKAGNGRPKSPNPKQITRLRSVTPSDQRQSINSLAETKNPKGGQNLNQKTTQLSTDLRTRRSNVANTTAKATNQKESHLNILATNLSKNTVTDSKTKPRSRGVSPLVRSTIPAEIPGFSNETPPNLRTDRSTSATRGRSTNPTPTKIRPKPAEPTVKPIRRQSCSPSVTRGRKVDAAKQESEGSSK
ncbi:hypothetical protein L1049_019448 [Liquidambar formosana]|uniref:Uncharacterized protein n=1 Tax=Liquidambar formosana TaxID=63359 RepID=A0AAP0SBN2_LIQFO